jgi:hypothetical protein
VSNSDKLAVKGLFCEIADVIEDCSDCVLQNEVGYILERGKMLSNGYSIMFNLYDRSLKLYNAENETLLSFTDKSEMLLPLKEMFSDLLM